jgi:SRSO17 transposase
MTDVARMSACLDWDRHLDQLVTLVAPHFRRVETRLRLGRYLRGLLSSVERKNSWQLAESMHEPGPQGVQRLLNAALWDAAAVRDALRSYVLAQLGTPTGLLVLDETGFLKNGTQSAGVARQYSGTAGRIENQQIGVFLAYASTRGYAFIDRELYMPAEWIADPPRCRRAGVPSTVAFTTKPALAQQMLARAVMAGVPARWVVADSVYHSDDLRLWIEAQGLWYVLALPCSAAIWCQGLQLTAQELSARLPTAAWVRLSAGDGSQGARDYEWAWLHLPYACPAGMRHWLLVRRSVHDPNERAYYHAYAASTTGLAELVQVAGTRWVIETGFAQAKGEVGLDHYQVRTWTAWYRYITLALLAYASLAVLSRSGGMAAPDEIPLTVPELRRLWNSGTGSAAERAHRQKWSTWRRRHQAQAKRSHTARRHAGAVLACLTIPAAAILGGLGALTQGRWVQIAPLLPARQAHTGRPAVGERSLLEAMLWVMETGVAWRAIPAALGAWHTVYTRYRQWVTDHIWEQVVAILGPDTLCAAPAEVSL